MRRSLSIVSITLLLLLALATGATYLAPRPPPYSVDTIDLASFDPSLMGYYGSTEYEAYLYLSPYRNGPNRSNGTALRLADGADPHSSSSWERMDLTSIRADLVGFSDAIGLGHFVYFEPYYAYTEDSYRYPSTIARYDTRGGFSDPASWQLLDIPGGVGGWRGGAAHNGKLYFGRYMSEEPLLAEITPAEVFSDSHVQIVNANEIIGDDQHYIGAASAGDCLYLTPSTVNWDRKEATFARFCGDDFADPGSWETHALLASTETTSMAGNAAFDGRYVYFAPYQTSTYNYAGSIVRHDTAASMDHGWEVFDQRTVGASNGYAGVALFDDKVAFVPYRNELEQVAKKMPMFDVKCSALSDRSCWSIVDLPDGGYITAAEHDGALFVAPLGHGPSGVHGRMPVVRPRS